MRRLPWILVLTLSACDSSAGGPDAASLDGGRDTDSGPPEVCATPGAVEHVPCGACGTVERFCNAAMVWVYAECDAGGACVPGAVRDAACGACGSRAERCTDACEWEASGECSGEGECAPGSRRVGPEGCPPREVREVLCSATCAYEPAGECMSNECDVPGVLESVACGRCGTQERFCTADGVWEYGACAGEGGCLPGSVEDDVACGNCGTTTRQCTASCSWETSSCEDEGECAAGTTLFTLEGCPPGQTRAVACNDACSLGAPGPCMGAIACVPACGGGESCGADGVCRCGGVASCTGTDECIDDLCQPPSCGDLDACVPTDTRSEDCGRCGTQTSVCGEDCHWTTGECAGEGECAPGTTTSTGEGCPPGQLRVLQCGIACSYSELSGCATPSPVVLNFHTTSDMTSSGDHTLSAWYGGTYIEGWRMTTLASTTEMEMNVTPTANYLASGCSLSALVFLNEVEVGAFSVGWGSTSLVTRTFTFPPIAGPRYTIRYETPDGRAGCGAVRFGAVTPGNTVTLRP